MADVNDYRQVIGDNRPITITLYDKNGVLLDANSIVEMTIIFSQNDREIITLEGSHDYPPAEVTFPDDNHMTIDFSREISLMMKPGNVYMRVQLVAVDADMLNEYRWQTVDFKVLEMVA